MRQMILNIIFRKILLPRLQGSKPDPILHITIIILFFSHESKVCYFFIVFGIGRQIKVGITSKKRKNGRKTAGNNYLLFCRGG